jgi:hypothetical protein
MSFGGNSNQTVVGIFGVARETLVHSNIHVTLCHDMRAASSCTEQCKTEVSQR